MYWSVDDDRMDGAWESRVDVTRLDPRLLHGGPGSYPIVFRKASRTCFGATYPENFDLNDIVNNYEDTPMRCIGATFEFLVHC